MDGVNVILIYAMSKSDLYKLHVKLTAPIFSIYPYQCLIRYFYKLKILINQPLSSSSFYYVTKLSLNSSCF